jgi:hypothetical protein
VVWKEMTNRFLKVKAMPHHLIFDAALLFAGPDFPG